MKKVFLILGCILSAMMLSQKMTFVYDLKFKPNPNKPDLTTETYYLDVFEKESAFRCERERVSDSMIQRTGLGLGRSPVFNSQIYVVKNLETANIQKVIFMSFFNDKYFINIDENLNWKILSDKKKIEDFECRKATVEYGGRSWIAWFTQSIPIPEGPYIFNGLPGIIVNISDDQENYSFNLIKIKKLEKDSLFFSKKGTVISWENFEKIQSDYYADPFAELKARNIKIQSGDEKGNLIPTDLNKMTKQLKKQIRENNNPIELNHKIDYE
ncbi:GLPGLI family protein [Chryseobacterium sp. SL1]|uniref:GLPGLI family protein n=1 Tax=Chryseobacterium sp. SL1 TaxID=2995159 RepID=UPI0022733049|nr:GLPGLI family protein [Chryseobacterium sp. SL1]MCY1661665.1 GLPGLI family protein [Chryseobacterium sp. SL1]